MSAARGVGRTPRVLSGRRSSLESTAATPPANAWRHFSCRTLVGRPAAQLEKHARQESVAESADASLAETLFPRRPPSTPLDAGKQHLGGCSS